MTNQEKDLKNAREYLDYRYPELQEELFHVYSLSSKSPKYTIDEMLASHVQWLEQKGVIQFTENRYNNPEEKNGLIKCKHCDRFNCKNNDSCIECGEPDYR